jgi:plasmid replication initiation protein
MHKSLEDRILKLAQRFCPNKIKELNMANDPEYQKKYEEKQRIEQAELAKERIKDHVQKAIRAYKFRTSNKSSIKENYIVEKRNILNEMRVNSMTPQEMRFFTVYLAKINPRDPRSREVTFPLSDFIKITGLKEKSLSWIKNSVRNLLQKIVEIPTGTQGQCEMFQLFKRCMIEKDEETGEWFILFDAHDDALPLMFDYKTEYFKYELWNTLRLKGKNQIRMYEILKQYEYLGYREISVEILRKLLLLKKSEYPRWNNFKTRILDDCKKALKAHTDIAYDYETTKRGTGGKILALKFNIYHNEETRKALSLDNFIKDPKPKPKSKKVKIKY